MRALASAVPTQEPGALLRQRRRERSPPRVAVVSRALLERVEPAVQPLARVRAVAWVAQAVAGAPAEVVRLGIRVLALLRAVREPMLDPQGAPAFTLGLGATRSPPSTRSTRTRANSAVCT